MNGVGYVWRGLTPDQRAELLIHRKQVGQPWHSPPHRADADRPFFIVTAACFNHIPVIGHTAQRMDTFSQDLLAALKSNAAETKAWCVLPNHYHALLETADILTALKALGRFHGKTSFNWNSEENCRGRQIFFGAVERSMRSERHYWATLNYVHHNPVRHGYTMNWTDWPWSSASGFLESTGRDEAKRIWNAYPLKDYGDGWDDPAI